LFAQGGGSPFDPVHTLVLVPLVLVVVHATPTGQPDAASGQL
jgi:hypothetical protein